MTKEFYQKISRPFRRHEGLLKLLLTGNKLLTLTGYIFYPLLLAILACHYLKTKEIGAAWSLLCYTVIPAISFAGLTIFRHKVNRPRPYEVLDINPLIKKDTKGHSFPSRHIFSMALIASCWLGLCVPLALLLLIICLFLAIIRVVGGVHYPADVLAGGIIGILCGLMTVLIA